MADKLVIFDCDGVLVDSEPISARVFTACLNDLGIPVDLQSVLNDYTGLALSTSYRLVEERWGIALPEDFHDRMQARTLDWLGREVEAVNGVRAVLDALVAHERSRCVASSGNFEKMNVTLGRTGLLPYFEGNLFSAWQPEVARGKPHPDLFLFAARSMATAPEDCMVIEDSPYGVRAARAAGMTVFGFVGGSHAFDLAGEGVPTFTDMAELPTLLDLH